MANRITMSICGEDYTLVADESAAYMEKVGALVDEKMTQLQEGATVFSTGWTKCEHRSCSGWTSSTARGRTTMACSSSVLAMIMARKVQSAPSTAIMPWGVELL